MTKENENIKQDLIRLFIEGKSEAEALEHMSNAHGPNLISLKIVSNWFTKFKSGEHSIDNKKKPGRKQKFSDEFLINLIRDNPDMNMRELAKLAGTTSVTISNRIKQIKTKERDISYVKKGSQNGQKKFTDEFLINLINENPNMSMNELAKLANTTYNTISIRLKQINSNEQKVNYVVKDFKNCTKKLTDEYLINLINENPGISSYEIAKLANISQQTVYVRLREINSTRSSEDKIVLGKNAAKAQKKSRGTITYDSLIKLVNENPELDAYELAKLGGVSSSTIYKKLKKINADEQRVNYIRKGRRNGAKKFTDEFLINLINDNPELNIRQLAELADTTMVTIRNRIDQININGGGANYIKKDFKNVEKKFTDEFLINLVDKNPELSTRGLAKLSNSSQPTISRRLNQINCITEQRANYTKKEFYRVKKFTDEFLINLVDENPNLNMSQLAKLANTSYSTISRRLKEINSNGERVKYVYKK